MSLDYKIYQDKELIAATATAYGASHMITATPKAVVKYAGRVVWNELKDGIGGSHVVMATTIKCASTITANKPPPNMNV